MTSITTRQQESKADRARRILVGAVAREDSDDELGLEDLPWQWVYEEKAQDAVKLRVELKEDKQRYLVESTLSSREHKIETSDTSRAGNAKIVGARMGSFECRIGDCVLLKAEGTNEAWVGLICEFLDDVEDGMVANFMWFSTEKEIRSKEKKRNDFMRVKCQLSHV